ncbi:MAG: hypothetical protein ACK559_03035 [bacterium]
MAPVARAYDSSVYRRCRALHGFLWRVGRLGRDGRDRARGRGQVGF